MGERKQDETKIAESDDLVWHYTDTSGFLNIVSKNTIRATDYRYLNDPLEGEIAKQVISSIRDEIIGMESNSSLPITLLQDRIKAKLGPGADYADAVQPLFPERGPYVVSLSQKGDLLSQWRAYAKSSGYSIAFRKEDLAKFANSYASVFQRVEYLNSIDDPRVEKFFVVTGELPELKLRLYLDYLCAYKMDGYEEECEWRLVFPSEEPEWYRPQASKKKYAGKVFAIPDLEFRDGMIGLTPFITLPLRQDDGPSLPIRHVIVGPGPNAELRKIAAEQLLDDEKIPVTLSRTELRA